MKTLCILISMAFGWAASAEFNDNITMASSGSTGGGFVLVCPETPISKREVQLLDLYEAEIELGFRLHDASGDLVQDYLDSVDRTYTLQGAPDLAETSQEDILNNLKKFFQSTKYVERPEDLPLAKDIGVTPWVPAECSIRQVAFFDDNASRIYILKTLWNELDSMNQAALVQHELATHWYRKLNEETSKPARNFVAHIFAREGLVTVNDQILPSTNEYSSSSTFESTFGDIAISMFWLQKMYGGSGSILRMQFSSFFGRGVFAKTWIDLPYVHLELERDKNPNSPHFLKCIVKNSGININGIAPLQGSMSLQSSIAYQFQSDKPIEFSLIRDGKLVQTNSMTSGTDCE